MAIRKSLLPKIATSNTQQLDPCAPAINSTCHVRAGAAAALRFCLCCVSAGLASKAAGKAPGEEITAAQLNECFIPGGKNYEVDFGKLLELGECAPACLPKPLVNNASVCHLLLQGAYLEMCKQFKITKDVLKQGCVWCQH